MFRHATPKKIRMNTRIRKGMHTRTILHCGPASRWWRRNNTVHVRFGAGLRSLRKWRSLRHFVRHGRQCQCRSSGRYQVDSAVFQPTTSHSAHSYSYRFFPHLPPACCHRSISGTSPSDPAPSFRTHSCRNPSRRASSLGQTIRVWGLSPQPAGLQAFFAPVPECRAI